jgi:excisionase family DNA binding protein
MVRVLNADEAARILRVSRKTLYRLAASGELRGRKVGREWRFTEDEILRFLKAARASAQAREEGEDRS